MVIDVNVVFLDHFKLTLVAKYTAKGKSREKFWVNRTRLDKNNTNITVIMVVSLDT